MRICVNDLGCGEGIDFMEVCRIMSCRRGQVGEISSDIKIAGGEGDEIEINCINDEISTEISDEHARRRDWMCFRNNLQIEVTLFSLRTVSVSNWVQLAPNAISGIPLLLDIVQVVMFIADDANEGEMLVSL